MEQRNGVFESSRVTLSAREIPYFAVIPGTDGVPLSDPFGGTVVTPLRFIGTSDGEDNVYKLGYPAKPGLARKDFVPDVPGTPATYGAQDDPGTDGDQRGEFITAPADWNLKVKAKTK